MDKIIISLITQPMQLTKYDQNLRYLPWNALIQNLHLIFFKKNHGLLQRTEGNFLTQVIRNNNLSIAKSFESGTLVFLCNSVTVLCQILNYKTHSI
jgi:hypothetical protein